MSAELEPETAEQKPLLRQLCRYLSERSPQPMVAVEGTTHVVIYVNPAFARLVGVEKDLVGRPFSEAVPEGAGNGCLALLNRVFRTGVPETLAEQEHQDVYPRPAYWSYSVWAILGEDDRPAGVMIQVTESTEVAVYRRQTQEMNEALMISATRQHELSGVADTLNTRLQAAVGARDHFLAVLSHELRNPLAAMSSGVQLIKHATSDPLVARNAGMVERQLKQLVQLVDDLLDVSRIATGKLELQKERIELAPVLRQAEEACRPIAEAGRHELTVELPPDPILLDADPARLTQAFQNLLNNAAKYSEPGGHIWLSARKDGGEVVVSVRDAGIGIAADQLPHVFEVFVQVDTTWQRSQGGLGIGLSLVKQFVELHGGRVEARSGGPGKGSEFVVRLPIAVDRREASKPLDAKTPCGPSRRILVVDDNKDAAESLAELLGLLGHTVSVAHGGEAGLAVATKFRPEVVLLDLGMPLVDGYECARRIRAEPWGGEPYLVALTGWGAATDRHRTSEAGFDRHLVKPVALDALVRMIAELPIKSP